MNLVIKGKCTSSYDAVYKDFIELSETRAQCCDESKTTISAFKRRLLAYSRRKSNSKGPIL